MRYSKEKFIEKSNIKHGNKYDYSQVIFNVLSDKVKIVCDKHGTFIQRASAHIRGQGCRKCNQPRPNLLSKDRFIELSNKIHKYRYDYSLVEYINSTTSVEIICPDHGSFYQIPQVHYLQGCECPKCSYVGRKKLPMEHIIERFNKVHDFKYDYSLISEEDRKNKIPIKCKSNHIFYMTIKDHMGGNGCKYCSMPCHDTESFIKLCSDRHGNKYDYSKTIYSTQKSKVIIICPRHGEFLQKASNHYHLLRGCKRCGESKGEMSIRKWLQSKGIEFKREQTFEDCISEGKLRFDFYLPDLNICIEFDGLQHFRPVEQFGGVQEFERVKIRDRSKNEYCERVGIRLIRINYKQLKKIDSILDGLGIDSIK